MVHAKPTRKAPNDDEENGAKKRPRVVCVEKFSCDGASFDDVNGDCLVNILSYLLAEDMNSVACMNKHCREARNHESLDQTRIAVIVCSKYTSIRTILMPLSTEDGMRCFRKTTPLT